LLLDKVHKTGSELQRNIEARSCNHHCSGKVVSVTYSRCLSVALDIQHSMRMRHIVVALPAVQYLYASSHKQQDFFLKNVIEHETW
jgi:hypothetical protein